MVEILDFQKGAVVIKLNAAVTNLNVSAILMYHCRRDKNIEYTHFTTLNMIYTIIPIMLTS
jgi:hypothetical protein